MDGFVCNLKNNSNQEQEINLFNSSDQNGQSTTTAYEYVGTLGGGTPIFSRASFLFYDQTILAVPGEVGVSFTKNDGTVLDFRTSANITNATASSLEVELNNKFIRRWFKWIYICYNRTLESSHGIWSSLFR